MEIHSYALHELTAARVAASFTTQQCVIVRGAIDEHLINCSYAAFKELMADETRLQKYPFNSETRSGYTPPGTEALQKGTERDWNRSMFDLNPSIAIDNFSMMQLYLEVAPWCQKVLRFLDEERKTELALLPIGNHTLRVAQYMVNDLPADEVLFPRHRDFSLLTAFIGSGMPGLEIEVTGTWCPVDLGPGDVLIGAGTPFTQLYKDQKSLWHRVVGGTGYRLSSFMFYELNNDVVLTGTGERYGDMLNRVLQDVRH